MHWHPLPLRTPRRIPATGDSTKGRTLAIIALAVAALALAACTAGQRESIAQGAQSARAELVDTTGQRIGEAQLSEGPHGVYVRLRLDGVPPGTRAIHVHEVGRCEPAFAAAGDHWNPRQHEHGLMNPNGPHAGDLPNLHVPAPGRVEVDFFMRDARLTGGPNALLDEDGAALVLHAGSDDHLTDPSGDSGDRVACGVIRS